MPGNISLQIAEINRNRPLVKAGVERITDGRDKFTKEDANYKSNRGKLFVACGSCVFWEMDNESCKLVSVAGEPDEGVINKDGLCDFYSYRSFMPGLIRISRR